MIFFKTVIISILLISVSCTDTKYRTTASNPQQSCVELLSILTSDITGRNIELTSIKEILFERSASGRRPRSLGAMKKNAPELYDEFISSKSTAYKTQAFLGLNHEQVIDDYIDFAFSRYTPEKIAQLSRQSRELALQGENIASLSRHNLERFKLDQHYDLPEPIADKISRISNAFLHNTHHEHVGKNYPILSSRELAKSGFATAGQNTLAFNRSLLKSDGNVFFFTQVKFHQDAPAPSSLKLFGDFLVYANRDKISSRAMITPFLMWPEHIIDLLRQSSPDLLKKYDFDGYVRVLEDLNAEFRGSLANVEVPYLFEQAHEEVLKFIKNYTFSIDDYETLIKGVISNEFEILKNGNPAKFQSYLNAFVNKDERKIDAILWDIYGAACERNFIPQQFEAKVPVAITPEELIYVERP